MIKFSWILGVLRCWEESELVSLWWLLLVWEPLKNSSAWSFDILCHGLLWGLCFILHRKLEVHLKWTNIVQIIIFNVAPVVFLSFSRLQGWKYENDFPPYWSFSFFSFFPLAILEFCSTFNYLDFLLFIISFYRIQGLKYPLLVKRLAFMVISGVAAADNIDILQPANLSPPMISEVRN